MSLLDSINVTDLILHVHYRKENQAGLVDQGVEELIHLAAQLAIWTQT